MKLLKFIPALILLVVGQVNLSYASQPNSCSFNSQLLFSGTQWQVKSSMGPVYLARREDGVWRVLAVFDGTNGKYHLDWQYPTTGEYAALDSIGACSESVKVGGDRAGSKAEPVAASAWSSFRETNSNQETSAFRRRMVAVLGNP